MELNCNPLWDECRELTEHGSHSAGESVYINGVGYTVGRLLYGPNRPEIADKSISGICDGYYRQLNFSV